MDDYDNLNHSVWDCKYHVIFPRAGRRSVDVGAFAHQVPRPSLHLEVDLHEVLPDDAQADHHDAAGDVQEDENGDPSIASAENLTITALIHSQGPRSRNATPNAVTSCSGIDETASGTSRRRGDGWEQASRLQP